LLACGFKLRELLSPFIKNAQGTYKPLPRLMQLPVLDGLNIPPNAVISSEISKHMVAAGLSL